MKSVKRILSYLWTAWCALVIATVVLILLPCFAIAVHSGIPSWKRAAHKMVFVGAKVVTTLWGIRIRVHNREVYDMDKQYIIVQNHRCDLDPIVALSVVGGYWKFLGKEELLKMPGIGYLVGQLYITVNRANAQSREDSIRQMEEQIQDGASIFIYPEGWSNFSEDYLLEMKQGAFHLSATTGIPIIVSTIIGSHELWPKPFTRVKPGQVDLYWEEVVDPASFDTEGEELKEALIGAVTEIWLRRLKEYYPNGYVYEEPADFEAWKEGQLRGRNQ